MRLARASFVAAGLLVTGTAHAQAPAASAPVVDLKVGDPAPAFSLPGSDGRTHALADHLGKRAVIVAWFPKAFTGG